MLYMSVEKLRTSAYTSFTDTISQTDLIIGANFDGASVFFTKDSKTPVVNYTIYTFNISNHIII